MPWKQNSYVGVVPFHEHFNSATAVMPWKAIAAGYVPGHEFELLLRRHLKAYLPDLTGDLNEPDDLEAFLVSKTHQAIEECTKMEEQGMPPEVARELTFQSFFPIPPDELDESEEWE